MKKLLILSVLALVGLASCKKNLETPSLKSEGQANAFKEIKTDENFSWKTTEEITLNVSPLNTPVKIVNTLKVSSADGKTIYLSRLASMDEAITEKLNIPSSEKSVQVSFGSISKSFQTTVNRIEFDYFPENSIEE